MAPAAQLNRTCPHCPPSKNDPELEIISRYPTGNAKNFPPLLFVHGGWHSAFCWDEYFQPYFASQGYECHAVSLRGHGMSGGKERMNFHRIADFARDICRVASGLPAPPVIIAHSLGGFITAHYLLHHRPAAVALLTPVPPNGLLSATKRWVARYPLRFLVGNLTLNPRVMIQSPQVAKELLFSETLDPEKFRKFHARLDSESYLAFLDGLFLDLPARPQVACPVLVVDAANDRIVAASDNKFTAEFFGAKLQSIPDIAHDVMLDENWQKTADVLLEFFSSVKNPLA